MQIDNDVKILWGYMRMNMPLQKADAIFVLCSWDLRVAEYAAQLFLKGYGDWVIVSGGSGRYSKGAFVKPEAEVFVDVIIAAGVPKEKIIIENKATNTGENVRFTYDLLNKLGLEFNSLLLVQKPFMERRTYATFKKQWPGSTVRITITSPTVDFEDYITGAFENKEFVIRNMVNDMRKIQEYPKLGFQIGQAIPDDAWAAYLRLIDAGYYK